MKAITIIALLVLAAASAGHVGEYINVVGHVGEYINIVGGHVGEYKIGF